MKLIAVYKVYNEEDFLPASILNIYPYVDGIFVNVSSTPWGAFLEDDPEIYMDNTLMELKRLRIDNGLKKIKYIVGNYGNEHDHITHTYQKMREYFSDVTHCLYIDADEAWPPMALQSLRKLVEENQGIDTFGVYKWVYWKNFHWVIYPPEPWSLVAFRWDDGIKFGAPPNCRHVVYPGGECSSFEVPPISMQFHHFSWVRKSEEAIQKKLLHSTHRNEILPQWYQQVWMAWNKKRDMKNLHPTHPSCYGVARKMPLANVPETFRTLMPYCKEDHLLS